MKANKRIRDLRRRPRTWRFALRDSPTGSLLFVTTWPMQKKDADGKQEQIPGMLVARLDGKENAI